MNSLLGMIMIIKCEFLKLRSDLFLGKFINPINLIFRTILHFAARLGDYESAKRLLDLGAPIEAQDIFGK